MSATVNSRAALSGDATDLLSSLIAELDSSNQQEQFQKVRIFTVFYLFSPFNLRPLLDLSMKTKQ